MFVLVACLIGSLLILPATGHTQSGPQPAFRLGGFGFYAANEHRTTANIFCCVECGQFSDGKGAGYSVGLLGEVPLLGDWLSGFAAIGFAQRGGDFGEAITGGLPILNTQSGEYVTLTRRHSYAADLGFVVGQFGGRVKPIETLPAYLSIGFDVAAALDNSATYVQSEQILEPSGVLYPELNTRIKQVGSGAISDVRSTIGVLGAIGYELPISAHLTAAPELRYTYPLAYVHEAFGWKIATFESGLTLRYSFYGTPDEPTPPRATLPPALTSTQPQTRTVLPEVAVKSEGGQLQVVETIVTQTFPILPYIFFDSADRTLNPRYKQIAPQERDDFKENVQPQRMLEAYYDIMNVVGSRLQHRPSATLTLTGTTDGREVSTQDQTALGLARASEVKDYIVTVWDIDPSRIRVTTGKPTFPSSTEYPEGFAENRRVEFTSADADLLGPILYERFREYSHQPRQLPVSVGVKSSYSIERWKLEVANGNEQLFSRVFKGSPPSQYNLETDDDFVRRMAPGTSNEDSLLAQITVWATNGAATTARMRLPVHKELNPFEISRLSLVVFDFDKSTLTQQNAQKVSEFARKSILPSSKLKITGTTDSLGELRHNMRLSDDRAFTVRDQILTEKPLAQIVKTEGVGPARPQYGWASPEGRYYARTVSIEVETPLEDATRLLGP